MHYRDFSISLAYFYIHHKIKYHNSKSKKHELLPTLALSHCQHLCDDYLCTTKEKVYGAW